MPRLKIRVDDEWVDAALSPDDVLNEDDFATGSTTQPPSQASVKAYVAGELDPVPTVSGLVAHWDAQRIVADDGDRIASWVDRAGGAEATQATSGKQPRYDIDAINGHPALWFDTSRLDVLAASVSVTGTAMTTFVVAQLPNLPADSSTGYIAAPNKYLIEANGSGRNLFLRAQTNDVGHQTPSTVFYAPSIPSTPVVLGAAYDGSSSELMVNGVSTSGSAAAADTPPWELRIGGRFSGAAGSSITGYIGEILIFSRALSTGEKATVNAYLGARWGIAIESQGTWYLDTVIGDDANDGRSPDAPVASLRRAFDAIESTGVADPTIMLNAPAANPLRLSTELAISRSGSLTMRPATAGVPAHIYGTVRVTDGWDSEGGGVYSRSLVAQGPRPHAWVASMVDSDGNPIRLITNTTSTTTTPAEGAYGYNETTDTYYIHLPGGVDPNDHVIEIAVAYNIINLSGGCDLYLYEMYLFGAINHISQCRDGSVTAYDAVAEFSGLGGWGESEATRGGYYVRTIGRLTGNDGFNFHGDEGNDAISTMVECEGAFNRDEGMSPHQDRRVVVQAGRMHHNDRGGITAIDNTEVTILATEIDHNQRDSPLDGYDWGGIVALGNAHIITTELYAHDNAGPGVEIKSSEGASWTDNGETRSGIAYGNGAEDDV